MSLTTGCFHTSTTVTIAWHFDQSPEAYDEAYEDFYESLDKLVNVWKQTDFYSEITLLTVMYEHTSH